MVRGEDAVVHDGAPVDGAFGVDGCGGQDAGCPDLVVEFAGLVEDEGEDVSNFISYPWNYRPVSLLVVGDRQDLLDDEFAVADDTGTWNVSSLPSFADMYTYDRCDSWCVSSQYHCLAHECKSHSP